MSRNNSNGDGTDDTAYVAPEKSKVIPVLAYDDDGGEESLASLASASSSTTSRPPEYAMIELNGNLIAPVEFPTGDTCRQIFGTDRRVELGKLYMKGPEKASVVYINCSSPVVPCIREAIF